MKRTAIIKKLALTVFTLLVLFVVMLPTKAFATKRCAASGCTHRAYSSGNYCSSHTCIAVACNSKRASGSSYCSEHKHYSSKNTSKNTSKKSSTLTKKKSGSKSSSSKSSSKKKYYYDSYDAGYEDVWLDDDYDWDRYWRDDDYASGVDDAMEDYDW